MFWKSKSPKEEKHPHRIRGMKKTSKKRMGSARIRNLVKKYDVPQNIQDKVHVNSILFKFIIIMWCFYHQF